MGKSRLHQSTIRRFGGRYRFGLECHFPPPRLDLCARHLSPPQICGCGLGPLPLSSGSFLGCSHGYYQFDQLKERPHTHSRATSRGKPQKTSIRRRSLFRARHTSRIAGSSADSSAPAYSSKSRGAEFRTLRECAASDPAAIASCTRNFWICHYAYRRQSPRARFRNHIWQATARHHLSCFQPYKSQSIRPSAGPSCRSIAGF